MNDQSELFKSYIMRGVEVSLARTLQNSHALSETDRRQAWHILSYALTLENAWPGASDLLLALAPKMARAGYWREWIPYLKQGLDHSRALHDLGVEAELSLHLGHLYNRFGQLDQAERYAGDAAQLFALLNDRRQQSAALNRLAEIARGRRDFPMVEDLTNQALDLFILNSDHDLGSKGNVEEKGHAFLIKGRAAINQQCWALADRHIKRALRLYDQTENLSKSAVCIQNLGRVRYMEQDYDRAIAYFHRSIGLLETVNDVFNLAAVRMNLGIAYSLSNRPYDALGEYSKAEPIFRHLHDRTHLAKNLNNQGMEMNNLECWAEAEQLLNASSALCLQLDNLQEYINTQDSLGLTYMGKEDFARAIVVFEQALALSEEHRERRFSQRVVADLAKHLRHARRVYAGQSRMNCSQRT